jgi:SNF family Na+-dependent transporter
MNPFHIMAFASVVIVFAIGYLFGSATTASPSNTDQYKSQFMKLCAMQIYPAPFTKTQCEQRERFVFGE